MGCVKATIDIAGLEAFIEQRVREAVAMVTRRRASMETRSLNTRD
jgi:hypothetical protein